MKILIIDGSADTSSRDTFDGYFSALKRAGHETYVYAASRRINPAAGWLEYSWRRTKRTNPEIPRPNTADVMYWSSVWSVEMALRLMPDWILVLSGMFFPMQAMALLRKASWPHSKMGLLVCDSPYDDNQVVNCLGFYDAVFTNERASVPMFQQFNPASYYLPACYDPDRHRPDVEVPEGTPQHQVVFVGTAFTDRVATLLAVDWSGIDFGLYGNFEQLGSRSKLRKYLRAGPVSNDYAAALYRNAKIGLNLHRTRLSSPNVPLPPGMAQSINPRAYELAACGAFQISNERAELGEVFGSDPRMGSLVPTFKTATELEGMIRSYLKCDEVRDRIARQLPGVVQGHTYDARAATLLEVLDERSVAA